MRNSLKLLAPISLLALAACSSETENSSPEAPEHVAEEAAADAAAPVEAVQTTASGAEIAPLPNRPDIPVTLPKMAYVFDYGFRLAGEAIAPLQQEHADMCEAQGP